MISFPCHGPDIGHPPTLNSTTSAALNVDVDWADISLQLGLIDSVLTNAHQVVGQVTAEMVPRAREPDWPGGGIPVRCGAPP